MSHRDEKRSPHGRPFVNGRGEPQTVPTKNTVGPMTQPNRMPIPGLKPKDLVMVPARSALALQADGWWVRQDIIWSKPNPMPESVRDRCTKAHEYLFLLSKSERYYFDAEAIKEPATSAEGWTDVRPVGWADQGTHTALDWARAEKQGRGERRPKAWDVDMGSNRTLIAGQPRSGRSGNKERKPASARGVPVDTGGKSAGAVAGSVPWEGIKRNKRSVWTVTTRPFKEAHFATFPPALIEPCILAGRTAGGVVLDPFGGAGTTGLVAARHGRDAILIELNPQYADMAQRRIMGDAPLLAEVAA